MLNNFLPLVITLVNIDSKNEIVNYGTGTVIMACNNEVFKNAYILTATHVLEMNKLPSTIYFNKANNTFEHNIINCIDRYDFPGQDMSILKVSRSDFEYLNNILKMRITNPGDLLISHNTIPGVGREIFYAGFPFFLKYNLNTWISYEHATNNKLSIPHGLLKFGKLMDIPNVLTKKILIDSINNPGFSGGPIFIKKDNTWELIGIITSKITIKQVNDLQKINTNFKDFFESDYVKNLDIGITEGTLVSGVFEKILEMEKLTNI